MDFSDNYNNLVADFNGQDITQLSDAALLNLHGRCNDLINEYNNLQLVAKRNGNSLYGTSASEYYSLADFDLAEDITFSAKHAGLVADYGVNNFFVNWETTKWLHKIQEFFPNAATLRKFTEYKPYTVNDLCVYGDTDSRYIDIDMILGLILDKDGNRMPLPADNDKLSEYGEFMMREFITPVIKQSIWEDCERRGARQGYLEMVHEVITRRTVLQKKKKYIMPVIWKDGKKLSKPKLVYKGVELKRGNLAPASKNALSKLVEKFLLENRDEDFLRNECNKLMSFVKATKRKDITYLISSVSGLRNITFDEATNEYVSEKNHIQMQIAKSWYNFIHKNSLQGEYMLPFEKQKMVYYYCDPRSGYKVIGIPDDVDFVAIKNLPKPDWNKMYYSCIVKPLLRYILDLEEVKDTDAQNFMIGLKTFSDF